MLTTLILLHDEGRLWNQVYRKLLDQAGSQAGKSGYWGIHVKVGGQISLGTCVQVQWPVQNAIKELT